MWLAVASAVTELIFGRGGAGSRPALLPTSDIQDQEIEPGVSLLRPQRLDSDSTTVSAGQVRSGWVRLGQVRSGQGRSGHVMVSVG